MNQKLPQSKMLNFATLIRHQNHIFSQDNIIRNFYPLFSYLLITAYELTPQLSDSESQVIEFINNVFLINDPKNEEQGKYDEVYERLDMSSDQIFSITKRYTSLYQDRKIGAFTQFSKKCGERSDIEKAH
ncbi:hypothetical protein K501DRAFT_280147 [Backusella circina FSU 941]|nr:hypothetical protein K501DRAFT_280147 [Backusella circina FSU 941]